jgi:hypothetical protein
MMTLRRDLGIQAIVCGVVLGIVVASITAQPVDQPLWDRAMAVVVWAVMTLWTATVGHVLVLRWVKRSGWMWTWPATVLALSAYSLVAAVLEGSSLADLVGAFVFTMMFFALPWGTAIFIVRALVEFVLVQSQGRRRQRTAGTLARTRY